MYKLLNLEFESLELAMNHAKKLNQFVTIVGDDFEVCGIFGVDTVVDGVCPDGVAYDWNKNNRRGRNKK